MFKQSVFIYVAATLLGSAIAAPVPNNAGFIQARKASASAGGLVACTNFDQSAAGFSSGGGGDTTLTPCDDLQADQVPFPCTNIQAVADDFGTALCSTINTAAATSQAEAAVAAATSTATASASTGTLAACTNFDQSAAGFSSGGGGDTGLTPCDDLDADQIPFPCTNIQAVANAFGTALCSTINTAAATSQAEAAAASATSTASASTGTLTACTNFDQSAAGFSSGGGGDTTLTPCDDLQADQAPFPCTNIQAVANAFGTALCSTLPTSSTRRSLRRMF